MLEDAFAGFAAQLGERLGGLAEEFLPDVRRNVAEGGRATLVFKMRKCPSNVDLATASLLSRL
eukprot:6922312-Lingulodinium_polyedra.AAC.1